jgi:hypothetical protein
MAAPKEIERKFWVRQLPAFVPELPHSQIQQAYLALGSDGNEIRLRQKDDTYWLTIKRRAISSVLSTRRLFPNNNLKPSGRLSNHLSFTKLATFGNVKATILK